MTGAPQLARDFSERYPRETEILEEVLPCNIDPADLANQLLHKRQAMVTARAGTEHEDMECLNAALSLSGFSRRRPPRAGS